MASVSRLQRLPMSFVMSTRTLNPAASSFQLSARAARLVARLVARLRRAADTVADCLREAAEVRRHALQRMPHATATDRSAAV
jgi:hypothetical protein